jgi:hypothetical protein
MTPAIPEFLPSRFRPNLLPLVDQHLHLDDVGSRRYITIAILASAAMGCDGLRMIEYYRVGSSYSPYVRLCKITDQKKDTPVEASRYKLTDKVIEADESKTCYVDVLQDETS